MFRFMRSWSSPSCASKCFVPWGAAQRRHWSARRPISKLPCRRRCADLLGPSMFVGDVVAGHGVTPLLQAALAKGCQTANGVQMVEAVQEMMLDFMLTESAPNLI